MWNLNIYTGKISLLVPYADTLLSFWFIVCSLYYAIKICAASEVGGFSWKFVEESSFPKESNLCLMSGWKPPKISQQALLKVGSLTVYKE